MIWYVIEGFKWQLTNSVLDRLDKGWGNGYVAVPPTHPAYKVDFDKFNIHGGITYTGFGNGQDAPRDWWVLGFDTSHYDDNIEQWPKEAVEAETKRLFCQLLDIELGGL